MGEYREIFNGRLVNVLSLSVFASCHFLNLSPHSPTETGDREPFLIMFQRHGSPVLEKYFWTAEDLYLKDVEKEVIIVSFLTMIEEKEVRSLLNKQ